jgi:hypothetical protein
VLYSFIKDALLSKVGIVKVWWETREEHERETYYDLDDAAFAIIAADPEVEIVAHTERRIASSEIASSEEANSDSLLAIRHSLPPDSPLITRNSLLHDVTVRTTRTRQCARVEGVPPEEFGIARNARSIRDADYCFHDVLRSEARLIAQGYDREQVRRLPSHGVTDTIEAQARDTVEEGTQKQGDEGQAARRAGQARQRQCECPNSLEHSRCERGCVWWDRRRAHGRRDRMTNRHANLLTL